MIHLWLPVRQGDIRVFHEAQWHRYDSWDSLSKALQVYQLKKQPVCLYIPTAHVTQIRTPISRQQLRQLGDTGINYLLEDYVVGSVDDLSVRHLMPNDNEVILTGISKQLLEQYKHSLALVSLELSAVLPDFMLLDTPKRSDCASVFGDTVTTLMRTHAYMGNHAEDIQLMASRLPMIETYDVIGSEAQAVSDTLAERVLVNTGVGELTPVEHPERHVLNLNPKIKRAGLPAYWKVVASVAAFAVLSVLVYDALRIWQYKKLEAGYQSQIIAQYKQWFPNERPPVDLRKTVGTKTSSNTEQGSTIFSLVSRVSPLLKQSGLAANRLSFQNDALEISINASNINDLETLVSKMTGQGISAQLGNVTPVSSRVEGIIKVTP